MTTQNTEQTEVTVYNAETGEIAAGEIVKTENENYKIVQQEDGKFKKQMKYHQFHSRTPETKAEKVELYKIFNDSTSTLVTPLKNMVGKEITIEHLFIQPYHSFDESNGDVTHGVTCTIQDVDGSYYATSSKTVYYRLMSMVESFGSPADADYDPLKVKVLGIPQKKGVQIDLEFIGFAE